MELVELFLVAVGLSADAFAVSLCRGVHMHRLNLRHAGIIALFFGGFQAGMPLLGWLLGKQFERYITGFDHWIAFGLLLFIGGRMIWESTRSEEACCKKEDRLNLKELTMMAVATSIDALAVGITFAFLKADILPAVTLIGLITFVLCYVGVMIGHVFGLKFKSHAEFVGGMVLVGIGTKILIEHLGIF